MSTDDDLGAALRFLTSLLDGAHRATPDELIGAVSRAGLTMGWEVDIHLVTFDQLRLVPLTPEREELGLDTPAGEAFRTMRAVHDGDTSWVPLVDGVERLGALRAVALTPDRRPSEHPETLRWASILIGHLVAVVTPYGDVITRVRGGANRTVEAELLWNLLPPLTYATNDVVIAGLLEPSEKVAGDAFDYAVEDGCADIALFDGTGHDLSSGLLTSVALATYRNQRRRGADLIDCAREIDRVLLEHTDAAGYATGVLARLDIVTGVLDYLNAGHPHPLLVRDGTVHEALDHSGRPLFGLGGREATAGRLQLEPGDRVLLYTDGITEARDSDGTFFGVPRLVALLEEHGGTPAPETLRLVVRDVLAHQRGVLQDDATLLLLEWSPGGGLDLLPV
ncbi:serine/threonine-protein phosphatase [Georgenia satyanarayanai]|uniref:PP2C family protein-serine/threonine phosphatase n=1 Tax=Georgenia satyanarayanai TaxID=860221 RepID=UPI00203B414A|nr:PP2C family protein-serine/threonine phosphatase [Georgenia satyanarayanai]MCM3660456.1 serine/threonine-protein phosphatase [Georgenia satyanarayanai]